MKINVGVKNMNGKIKNIKIDSKDLDIKIHYIHTSGKLFTEKEASQFKIVEPKIEPKIELKIEPTVEPKKIVTRKKHK